jgi:hypothetical protein
MPACVLATSLAIASEPGDAPAASPAIEARHEAPQANPREGAREQLQESLSLLGFDSAFFADFKDGEPLSEEEQGQLARLLHGLPRIGRAIMMKAARHRPWLIPKAPERTTDRGQAYNLRFEVLRVTREEVPPTFRESLGYASYYRCVVESASRPAVVLAREVPQTWKLDAPIKEHGSAAAIYIKELPADSVPARQPDRENVEIDQTEAKPTEPESAVPLFAADRAAWHPETLLARLGVDYGLFDAVKDKAPLKERDLFYEMLATARGMSPQYVEYQIKHLLENNIKVQEQLARKQNLPADQRAAAQRALEQAQAGVSDVVPLFNEPASQRGAFVVLRGEALRAIEIRVEDPQIRARFDIEHYYEVDMVTPESQNNPIVCCLAQLPPEMPLGESIHESVRVAGFFMKAYAFPTRRSVAQAKGERQLQVAPLIVGSTLTVIPTPRFGTPTQSLTLAVGLLIVMAVCGAFMWHMRRMDRRAEAQLKLRRELLPEAISLADQSGPDPDHS